MVLTMDLESGCVCVCVCNFPFVMLCFVWSYIWKKNMPKNKAGLSQEEGMLLKNPV